MSSISPTTTMGNCPFAITYEITGATTATGVDDASGEVFNLGTSQVCYTITETMDADSNGIQTSTCCFTIIVEDTEAPVVVCPADEVISTDEGLCEAGFTWTHPDTSDNCGVTMLEISYQNPDGTLEGPTMVMPGMSETRIFALGTTLITYTITDQAGNTSSCSWTVRVEDNEAPMITCIGDTLVSVDEMCVFVQDGTGFDPLVSDNCSGTNLFHDYLFAPDNTTLAGAEFAIGNTTVSWTLTDAAGNSSNCVYTITVQDTIPPMFVNCPADTIVVGSNVNVCGAFVNFSIPIAEDNCQVNVSHLSGPMPGDSIGIGFFTVQYLALDDAGNTDTCEFVIHVQDTQDPLILCPSNDVVVGTDDGTCTWNSPAGSLTPNVALGNCPYDVTWIITNPDGSTASGTDDASGYTFALDTSVVCYYISESEDVDNNGILMDSCCYLVIVQDDEAPLVTCPADTIVECNGLGNTDALNLWLTQATAQDNCDADIDFTYVIWNTSNGCGSTAEVTYQFTGIDDFGNTSTCLATFTVQDTTPPVAICCPDLTIALDANGVIEISTDMINCGSTDICSADENLDLQITPSVFTTDDIGPNDVTLTVTDECGNVKYLHYNSDRN